LFFFENMRRTYFIKQKVLEYNEIKVCGGEVPGAPTQKNERDYSRMSTFLLNERPDDTLLEASVTDQSQEARQGLKPACSQRLPSERMARAKVWDVVFLPSKTRPLRSFQNIQEMSSQSASKPFLVVSGRCSREDSH
jgi:hypothetical protein